MPSSTVNSYRAYQACCKHSKTTPPHSDFFCTALSRYLAEQQDLQWKPSCELEALPSRQLSRELSGSAAAAGASSGGLASMSSQQIKYMRQHSLVPLYIAGVC
jgi:hypothetical protein